MIRIAGVGLKESQQLRFSLTNIKGIGKSNVKSILSHLNLAFDKKIGDLSEEELLSLRKHLEENYTLEEDLTRNVKSDIKRLKDIKSWRGSRHRAHLTTRGQRTKTNSRTVRGNKRSTAGSGKTGPAQKT